MAQHEIDDETLMAYADGELPPDEASRLAARLADDPALAQRLEAFTRSRDALADLRRADANGVQVPDAPAGATRRQDQRLWRQRWDRGRLRKRPAPRIPLWSGALAASLALAIGLGAGLLIDGSSDDSDPAIGLANALDSVPSGNEEILADGTTLRPVASFRAADGTLCREYELASPEGPMRVEIACVAKSGWQPQMMVVMSGAEGYAPAIRT